MHNQISTEEVANQFAKAIQLLLEWARQEMLTPSPKLTEKPTLDKNRRDNQSLPEPEKLLKVEEVANILQTSQSKIYQMIERGEITNVRFGRSVRVRRQDLDLFIDKNKKTWDS